MKLLLTTFCFGLALFAAMLLHEPFKPVPPPKLPEPTTPPARSFHDPRSGVTFQIPAAWELYRKDGEVSTFALDVRTAPRSSDLRAVANITFNPFPDSTFSGAYFYLSLVPHAMPSDCAHQAATLKAAHQVTTAHIDGISFTHGYDEHGRVCIESRDEIYTAAHNGACYRFDLVINNFCGGDVSGVKDITAQELESVRQRLDSILNTVQFDKK